MKTIIVCETPEKWMTTPCEEVQIITVGPSAECDIRAGNQLDRMIHRAIGTIGDTFGLHSSRATSRMADHIKALSPDVVHIPHLRTDWFHYPDLLCALARTGITIAVEDTDSRPGPVIISRRAYHRAILSRFAELGGSLIRIAPENRDIADFYRIYQQIINGQTSE